MKTFITAFACLTLSSLFSQSLSDGLLLYYPCNGDATDLSGNDFDGISTATATEDRNGISNAAVNFDGINQYVIIPAEETLKPELPVSISFWANFDGVADISVNWGLFNNDDSQDQYSGIFISYNNDLTMSINVCDGGGIGPDSRRTLVTTGTLDTVDWHHYVLLINGLTDMKIIIDCLEQDAIYTGTGGGLQYTTESGALGRRDNSASEPGYYKGRLDEVGFWNRILTEDEIEYICNGYDIVTSVYNIPLNSDFEVFPSPTYENLYIKTFDKAGGTIEIFNLAGEKVYSSIITSSEFSIDIKSLSAGLYFVNYSYDNSKVTRKIEKL